MNLRTALAGASAILVVALVLGADLSTRPASGVGEFQREALVERPAVRHLTTSLARAVRELVGDGARMQGPAITAHLSWDLGPVMPVGMPVTAHQIDQPLPAMILLPALIDLPPPERG
jgi:hypothetical protein